MEHSATKPALPLTKHGFWGGVISVVFSMVVTSYSYVTSLKADLQIQSSNIAVMQSELADLKQSTQRLDAKIDRVLLARER